MWGLLVAAIERLSVVSRFASLNSNSEVGTCIMEVADGSYGAKRRSDQLPWQFCSIKHLLEFQLSANLALVLIEN